MGTASPAAGIDIESGAWGTDFDQATDQTFSWNPDGANTSIKYPSGGSNSAMLSTSVGIMFYRPQAIEVMLRASSVAAGRKVKILAEAYDNTGSLIGTHTVMDAVLPVANQWICVRDAASAIASAAFYKLKVGKDASAGFDLWWGAWRFTPIPKAAKIYKSSDQTGVVAATRTKLTLNTSDYDNGNLFATSSQLDFSAFPEPNTTAFKGNWEVYAQAVLQNLAAGKSLQLEIYDISGGAPGAGGVRKAIALVSSGAAGDQSIYTSTGPIQIDGSMVFAAYITHGDAVNRTVTGAADSTWLAIREIGGP